MRLRKEQEMIALFFKSDKEDPLILSCRDCLLISQQIRDVKGQGLVKKETVNKALHLIQSIQAHESALDYQPSLERVNEISSLYDQAAEQFEMAGEQSRRDEVMAHKMKFLSKANVESIISGTHAQNPQVETKREPEVFESSVAFSDDENVGSVESDDDDEPEDWADFGEMLEGRQDTRQVRVDNMLDEARQEFDTFNLGDEINMNMDVDQDGVAPVTPDFVEDGTAFKEFEAIMNIADRELDEIRMM